MTMTSRMTLQRRSGELAEAAIQSLAFSARLRGLISREAIANRMGAPDEQMKD